MANISQIRIGDDVYDIKDAVVRATIADLATVAFTGNYGDLNGQPLWKGTTAEYEAQVDDIPVDTLIFITDDEGNVIEINYADLINKPQINGNVLEGNKTGTQLGLVDAVSGKGLSTNDYTDADKSKLGGITTGAQPNVIESISVNGVAQTISNKNVDITVSAQVNSDWNATSGVAQILNKPELGTAAAKNSTSAVTASSTDLVESGAVKSAIDAAVSSSYHHAGTSTVAGLTSSLLVAANEGNVYNITDSGTTTSDFIEGAGKPINSGDNVGIAKVAADTYKFDLLSGFIDTSAFIEKSATSGLVKNDGSIDATAYAKQSEMSVTAGTGADADKTTIQLKSGTSATVLVSHQDISGKVDKVTGKGLSTEDYSTAEKTKLDGIEANADVNVIESISLGGTEQVVTNKNVDLPTMSSTELMADFGATVIKEFNNGSGTSYLYSNNYLVCTGTGEITYGQMTSEEKEQVSYAIVENGVQALHQTFSSCRNLISVALPDTLTEIGNLAFDECYSLISCNIPNGVITIGNNAFGSCISLLSLTIPDSVRSMGANALTNLRKIEKLVIPNSVTTIGDYAFSFCVSLESIEFFEGLTTVGADIFRACSSLADIYYHGTEAQWNNITGIADAGIPETATIHYEYTS